MIMKDCSYSVLPPPTICTSSIMTRYHSHMTRGLLGRSTLEYCAMFRRGRVGGARATPRSCWSTLYVVMQTSKVWTYPHQSRTSSSLSPSSVSESTSMAKSSLAASFPVEVEGPARLASVPALVFAFEFALAFRFPFAFAFVFAIFLLSLSSSASSSVMGTLTLDQPS